MIALAILAAILAIACGVGWGLALALFTQSRLDHEQIRDLQDRIQAGTLEQYKAHVAVPAWEPEPKEWYGSATGTGLIFEPAE